jgi:hypothetical protein
MAVHGLPVGEAALQSDRPQAAWDHAEKLSRESGHPYTDRYGHRQNVEAEEVGITKTVLQRWCHQRGEQFDC